MIKKEAVRFSLKLMGLLVIVLLLDFLAGIAFDYLYATSKFGVTSQEYKIMTDLNEQVLIFGTSRAAYHYVPDILEKKLNKSTYNAGREGTGKFFQYTVFLSNIEKHKPELIILDFDYREFYAGDSFNREDDMKELAPFYGEVSQRVDSMIIKKWYDRLLLKSNLLKYNQKAFPIITGNLIRGREFFKGYRPLSGEWEKTPDSLYITPEIDNEKLNVIKAFIETAIKNEINVVLVASPYYKLVSKDLMNPLIELASVHNLKFYNYINDSRFINSPHLFNDELHLNNTGAKEFTSILSEELVSDIQHIKISY